MSVEFRTMNALLLAAAQSAAGTEAAPTPGSNAVRVSQQIGFSPSFETFKTQFVQGSISVPPAIVGGARASMKLSTFLTPSTAAGAAADPDYGILLRGCSMQEVKTAADSAGTSQAISSGNITLKAGASAVDGAYTGMVIEGTNGTINGQRRVITTYSGTTKIATTFPNWSGASGTPTYAIRANSVYVPITTAPNYLTLWGYQHSSISGNSSRRRRLMDAMGTFQISGKPRQPAKLDFTFTGVLPATPDDVSKPAAPTFLGLDPQGISGGLCYYNDFVLGASLLKFTDFSIDIGNTVTQFDDPNSTYGYDSADIPTRDVTGTITPNMVSLSTRTFMANVLSMTNGTLWLSWGSVGKGVSILLPSVRLIDDQSDDSGGFQVEKLKFDAGGLDSEVYICVF